MPYGRNGCASEPFAEGVVTWTRRCAGERPFVRSLWPIGSIPQFRRRLLRFLVSQQLQESLALRLVQRLGEAIAIVLEVFPVNEVLHCSAFGHYGRCSCAPLAVDCRIGLCTDLAGQF